DQTTRYSGRASGLGSLAALYAASAASRRATAPGMRLFWTDVVVDARCSVLASHWGLTGRSPGSPGPGDCAAAPAGAASASVVITAPASRRRLLAPAIRVASCRLEA